MKVCKICGEQKPLTDFYKVNKNSKHHHGKCKTCYVKKQQETYDPVKKRDENLKRLYGIGLKEYDRLLQEQGGCCAVCGGIDPKGRLTGRGGSITNFYVDHDHNTGKVRGLLCNTCNRTIGYIGDNTGTLTRMIDYLTNHR